MFFLKHMQVMAALECVTGSNHKSVSGYGQYVTADFKDRVELPDNAMTVISIAVEVHKALEVKQFKQLIVNMTTFWYNEE